MRRGRFLAVGSFVAAVFLAVVGGQQAIALEPAGTQQEQAARELKEKILPFFKQYCLDCHSGEEAEGELRLDELQGLNTFFKKRRTWEQVAAMLRVEAMPPEDAEPRPDKKQTQQVLRWVQGQLESFDCNSIRFPGRVTIRRLNRVEYRNTVRDLLGVDYAGVEDFPADDVGYGYDNIGDVLTVSAIHLEKYLDAAEWISQQAFAVPESAPPAIYSGNELRGGRRHRLGRLLVSTGRIGVQHPVPYAGRYTIIVRATGDQAGPAPVLVALRVDGKKIAQRPVRAQRPKLEVLTFRLPLQKGRRRIEVEFLNDYYRPRDPDPQKRGDRNLYVNTIEIHAPARLPEKLPWAHKRYLRMHPGKGQSWESAARRILRPLMSRAYRRPARPEEVQRLIPLVLQAKEHGEPFERGMQLALQAILVSPHFLYRVERDPAPEDPDGVRLIDEFELATRLSYFLWSTMPDEELFLEARKGTLRKNLKQQVLRMLASPKAQALVKNFAGQWLQLRLLDNMTPDPDRFPTWNDRLREAMRRETELFFQDILQHDRSILLFLDADYTFLNETLARHYGIPGVRGEHFRRVELRDPRRGGVLTQASVLTITSNPTRTSPVKRGKWIMEQILGTPPPPPPGDAPPLPEGKQAELKGTLRQRLEQHRANPVCASCHRVMDQLGFAFENYDAVGRWRDKDGPHPIDPSGKLPDGRSFRNAAELKKILLQEDEKFRRTFVSNLLTYALGRGLEYFDRCAVEDICKQVKVQGDRFSAVVLAIVQSDPFQKRAARRDPFE